MDGLTLTVSTLLKIGFVLVILFSFAPVMVWAERRQSAMIQDRVGPHRAGLTLPTPLAKLLLVGPALLTALLAVLLPTWFLPYTAEAPPTVTAFLVSQVGIVWAWASLMVVVRLEAPSEPAAANSIALGGLFANALTIFAAVATDSSNTAVWQMMYLGGAVLFAVGSVLGAFYATTRMHGDTIRITVIGLLHPAADAMKMLWKEDFVPPNADKFLHGLAPIITVVPAIATFAVIPFADTVYLSHLWATLPGRELLTGTAIPMQVASVNVGILFVFAVAGTGVVGAAIGGYASDNKFSLMGGLRAAGQMVSYEVALGLTVVGSFMVYESLLLEDMVRWQSENVWGIVVQPLGFILFLAAAIAETKRIPFDLPEGESELVGGYFTEYSGMKFGMFMTGEFIEVIVLSGIATAIFLGGYNMPFLTPHGLDLPGEWVVDLPWLGGQALALSDKIAMPHWLIILSQVAIFVGKLILFIWFQLMIRWTLPRFRYDQLMSLCWKVLLPLALANILLTGMGILLFDKLFS